MPSGPDLRKMSHMFVAEALEPRRLLSGGHAALLSAAIGSGGVNASDDPANGYYVSPTGSNSNDGLSPSTPMASLSALLAAYPFVGGGATIHLAGGAYTLTSNVVLTAFNNGLTIAGPTAGPAAVLNRGNSPASGDVIELQNASSITLEDLTLTGGQYGIYTNTSTGGVGSPSLTVTGCTINANASEGIFLDFFSSSAFITNNTITSQTTGIETDGPTCLVQGNTISTCSSGIYIAYASAATQAVDNTVFNCATGIDAVGMSDLISGNAISQGSTGILVGNSTVSGNTVSGQSGYGIVLTGGTIAGSVASQNTVYSSQFGIVLNSGTASGNRLYDNTVAGLLLYAGVASGQNQIYSNAIGVQVGYDYAGYLKGNGGGAIQDNVIDDNSSNSIWAQDQGLIVLNNTITQAGGGDAVFIQGGSNITVNSNTILVQGAGGDALFVENNASNVTVDGNTIHLQGAAGDALRFQTGISGVIADNNSLIVQTAGGDAMSLQNGISNVMADNDTLIV